MGRRARARGQGPAPHAAVAAPVRGVPEAKRVVGAYLAAAVALAVVVLAGIIVLGGTLGPVIVLVVAVPLATLLHRWSLRRLGSLPLSDEDRIMQTLGGGIVVLTIAFAVLGVIISAVAG